MITLTVSLSMSRLKIIDIFVKNLWILNVYNILNIRINTGIDKKLMTDWCFFFALNEIDSVKNRTNKSPRMDPQIYQHSVYARITCHYPLPKRLRKLFQHGRKRESKRNRQTNRLQNSEEASLETRSARVTRCLCPESTLYYLISTRNEENHAWRIHFFHGE